MPYGPDAEADPAAFNPDAFIGQAVADLGRRGVDGVVSSSDYPGCLVAASIAERLELPGPTPAAVIRASHKYYARLAMQGAIPEATPPFALIRSAESVESGAAGLEFPFFVKPVKSWFSQHARVVRTPEELRDYLADPRLQSHLTSFVRPLNQLLDRYAEFSWTASHVIGEELLLGRQVTVEGYILDEEVGLIGIVESIMYPGKSSFEQFVYPAAVDANLAAAMVDIVARAVRGLGLTWTLFNVELIFDEITGAPYVLEVNPRMCGQFADLMESVNGVNTYEILCEVALGRNPTADRAPGRHAFAASFPRRRFADGLVVATPSSRRIAQVMSATPANLIAVYYRTGQRLSEVPKHFDGSSFRYATINVAAEFPEALRSLADHVELRLGLRIE